ncbi:MAG: hypothetical protein LBL43_04555 [Treponema sp.]|jgi:hypothetical protein|nr:hypothetical protein [Treponema sp.]
MKKFAFVPFFAFLVISLTACGSLPLAGVNSPGLNRPGGVRSGDGEPFWTTLPSPDGLVFIGAAGIRSKTEESVQLALEDAARKVALFNGVEGSFTTHTNIGAGTLDYQSGARGSLAFAQDYKKYIDSFDFDEEKDVLRTETSLFVRVRYPGSVPVAYRIPPRRGDEKPAWVDEPPLEISGYEVGLGYAGRRATHRDTVITSYENAVFAIIRNAAAAAGSRDVLYEGSGAFDYSAATQNEVRAYGSLSDFYVLDTWTDPASMVVWTLAVAQKKQ